MHANTTAQPETNTEAPFWGEPSDPIYAAAQSLLTIVAMCGQKDPVPYSKIQEVAKLTLEVLEVDKQESEESVRRVLHQDFRNVPHNPDADLSEVIETITLMLADQYNVEDWPESRIAQTVRALAVTRHIALKRESAVAA